MPGESIGTADAGNIRLAYGRAGSGPSVVFIHAGITDRRMWDTQVEAFSIDFTAVRYDMRGFGESEMVDEGFSHQADLIALFDALGMDEVALVGCSIGAAVALEAAIEQPSRVAALVLIGAGTPGVVPEDGYYEPPQDEAAVAAFEAGELDRAAALETEIWVGGYGRSVDDVPASIREAVFEMDRKALETETRRNEHQRWPDPGSATRLDEVRCPTLLLVGANDLPDIVWGARYLAANIANAAHVVVPDAAHLPNMEHPAVFNQTVLAFLQSYL